MKVQIAFTLCLLALCHSAQLPIPTASGPSVYAHPADIFPNSAHGIFPAGNNFYQAVPHRTIFNTVPVTYNANTAQAVPHQAVFQPIQYSSPIVPQIVRYQAPTFNQAAVRLEQVPIAAHPQFAAHHQFHAQPQFAFGYPYPATHFAHGPLITSLDKSEVQESQEIEA